MNGVPAGRGAHAALGGTSRISRWTRSWWGAVLLLTLLGLGVRLAYVAAYQRCDPITQQEACTGPKLSGDAAYYHNAANLLADGKGYIDPYRYLLGGRDVQQFTLPDGTPAERDIVTPVGHVEPTAGHPPAYVTFLAVASLLGLRTVLAHQIVSAFLGAAAIPLIALAGRRLAGNRVGLIAGGVAAVYAMLWVNDGLVMSESLVVVGVPVMILAALRFGRAPTAANAALFGLAGALGALTRAELALFLPIVAAAILLRRPLRWNRRLALYAVCGLVAVAGVAPWVVRNLNAFEHPVYLSNGVGTVMVQTNCDAVYYGRDIGYWNLGCGAPMPYGPNGELLDESERDVVVRRRALDYIGDHKTRLVTAVIPARVGRMFSVVQPIRQLDLEVLSEDRPKWISGLGLGQYAVLMALAAVGVRELWRRRLPVLPVVVWLGLVAFTAAFAFGNMRYRVAAEPAIVLLGAVGIDRLWCRLRPRRSGDEAGTIEEFPPVPAAQRPLTPAGRMWARVTGTPADAPRRPPPRSVAPGAFTGWGTSMPHLPALDGLRGIAVILVLLFHGGYEFWKGGFLGVSTFFTLSGFLITNLLVREHDRNGRIDLREFWSRRFRRLMPASVAALLGIAVFGAAFGTPEQLANLRGDIIAALGYVANWRFYFSGTSYGDLFSAPSPVQHFWSLAIEEQFYLVFPLLAFLLLAKGGRRLFTALVVVAAAASLSVSVSLGGDNVDLVYYGTHTRAFELLSGVLLALWWSARRDGDLSCRLLAARAGTLLVPVGGFVALAATFWAAHHFTDQSPTLARGGFAVHALVVSVVILALTQPGPLASLLSIRPLRFAGLISYGLYLYHWPIFLALSPERTGLSTTPLFVLRMTVTIAVSLVSYHLIEQPIRRGYRLRSRPTIAFATPVALIAVLAAAVIVTADPPPSKIAYANAPIGNIVEQVQEIEPPPTSVAPENPVARTVMIVGDSGMVDAQPGIAAAFGAAGATRIVSAAGPGFGLTSSAFTWRDDWAALVAEHRPDLVVAMLGGWDLEFLDRRGDAAYAEVVDEAARILTAQGAHLLWLSMLPGGTTPDRPANRVFSELPGRFPGTVAYHDTEASLRGPAGDWPRAVRLPDGTASLWRKPDAWHLCPDGVARLAGDVVAAAADLGWSARPADDTWHQGAWRSSDLYDDPKGGCDVTRYRGPA